MAQLYVLAGSVPVISKEISYARTKHRISIKKFAELAGYNYSFVRKVERGEVIPTAEDEHSLRMAIGYLNNWFDVRKCREVDDNLKLLKWRGRNSINYYLWVLRIPGAYIENPHKKRWLPGKQSDTILTRMQPYEILHEAERSYKELAKKAHPDGGGDPELMRLLNEAIRYVRRWAKKKGAS